MTTEQIHDSREAFQAAGKQMTDELNPCPFCGGDKISSLASKDIKGAGGTRWPYAQCLKCCAKTDSPEAWNTRPVEDALRERVQRLEEALRSAESFIKRRAGGGETDFREGLLKALEEKHG